MVTFIGYFFLPIGLLLILTVEPRRLFLFWKRDRPPIDATTIMLAPIWWASFNIALGPGSGQPALYKLCALAFFICCATYMCLLMYRADRDPQRPARPPGDRRNFAAGLLFLVLGLFCAFDRSAEAYLDARHRTAAPERL